MTKMESDSEGLKLAYKYCREVTRHHAKSFYFAAKFLPKNKRLPIYALYALCRHVDDEVDEAEVTSESEAVAAVNRWKEKLNDVYKGNQNIESENSQRTTRNSQLILLAWENLLKTYKIPQYLPLELMQGVLMDTHIKRYESFDELYVYCYRVASTVGLMSSKIFGYTKSAVLNYAEALGIAMQLTNILRDIKEDAEIGRIYLPQEDLRVFGVSEKQIFACQKDDNFLALMKFEIARTREFYRKAERGIPMIEKDARFTVLLASRIYEKILDEIEKMNYDVFARRAHTTKRQKIFSIPTIWLKARQL